MQLVNTKNANIFNVLFNEKETHNLRVLLNSAISCRNNKLCYCIERVLPQKFEQFYNRRVMIMDVYNGNNFITSTVSAQNIQTQFKKPLENTLRITKVEFLSENAFRDWKDNHSCLYKVTSIRNERLQVMFFNLSIENEFSIALNPDAEIISSNNAIGYMLDRTINKFRECLISL